MTASRNILAAAALCAAIITSSHVGAATFYGSFTTDEPSAGTGFLEEDIFFVSGNSITLFVDGTTLSTTSGEDLDALYINDGGRIDYSFTSTATIPDGVGSVTSGDIAGFDSAQSVGSQFSFVNDTGFTNVDAYWNVAGVPYFSLSATSSTVGTNSLTVKDDEVFTLIAGVATSVFDSETALGISGDSATDVDAFAITDDGKFLFSTSSDNDFLVDGGDPQNPLDFINRDGGVVYIYDPAAPGAFDPRSASSIYYDGSAVLGTSVNIDALHYVVPEPCSAVLVSLASCVLLRGIGRTKT